jgi:hypothetical protein
MMKPIRSTSPDDMLESERRRGDVELRIREILDSDLSAYATECVIQAVQDASLFSDVEDGELLLTFASSVDFTDQEGITDCVQATFSLEECLLHWISDYDGLRGGLSEEQAADMSARRAAIEKALNAALEKIDALLGKAER